MTDWVDIRDHIYAGATFILIPAILHNHGLLPDWCVWVAALANACIWPVREALQKRRGLRFWTWGRQVHLEAWPSPAVGVFLAWGLA